jgi:hypothetical protein
LQLGFEPGTIFTLEGSKMFEWIFGLGFIGILLFVLASIFWIWMLIDCLLNPRLIGVEKLVWVLVIFFLHLLGAIIYFAIGRQRVTV